ncbi:MAG: outer membrane protein transport protein [Deltaproteobacteria bacterium]|nr:outer membrane protein transport protein [Deltaproteobacteria bacterium]
MLGSIAALAPGAAGATTLELYGFGPRAIALGNASEAASDDFYAAYANPANLALARHIHFGFGLESVWNRFGIDRRGGEATWPTRLPKDNYLAQLGISTPLPGWLQDRAAIGVAIHVPLGGPTRLDSLDHRIPQLPMYDTLGDRLALVASLGVRPVDWLAVGASAQVLTGLDGRADIGLSVLDQRVTYKALQVDLGTVVTPLVGVTVLPADGVRLAIVWRAESSVRYELPLAVDIDQVGSLDFKVKGIGLWLPDSYAVAASWQAGRWIAAASAAWQRWSQMPPIAPDVSVRIDNSELLQPGSKAIDLISVRNVPVPMGTRDIVVPRAGVEFRPSDAWTLRGGAQYRPTPFPKADGEASYLDAAATTLALGFGRVAGDPLGMTRKPLQLDFAAGWTTLARRTVVKRDPSHPVGATSVYGDSWHLALALHHDF